MQGLCSLRDTFLLLLLWLLLLLLLLLFVVVIVFVAVFKLLILCGTGWQPRRTIMFAHWDAGDLGQLGSYEWVEVFIRGSLTFMRVVFDVLTFEKC